jgi:hypothetical protein
VVFVIRVVVGVTDAAVLAFVGSVAASSGRDAGCVAGMTKVAGVQARTFCGPARATVHLNGKTVIFEGGQCSTGPAGWTVNIGTVVLGTVKAPPEYFGVTAKAKAGSHANQAVALDHAGKGYAITQNTVTLKPGIRSGTFTGTAFGSSSPVTGTFSC